MHEQKPKLAASDCSHVLVWVIADVPCPQSFELVQAMERNSYIIIWGLKPMARLNDTMFSRSKIHNRTSHDVGWYDADVCTVCFFKILGFVNGAVAWPMDQSDARVRVFARLRPAKSDEDSRIGRFEVKNHESLSASAFSVQWPILAIGYVACIFEFLAIQACNFHVGCRSSR